jgi:hypothetical protein
VDFVHWKKHRDDVRTACKKTSVPLASVRKEVTCPLCRAYVVFTAPKIWRKPEVRPVLGVREEN